MLRDDLAVVVKGALLADLRSDECIDPIVAADGNDIDQKIDRQRAAGGARAGGRAEADAHGDLRDPAEVAGRKAAAQIAQFVAQRAVNAPEYQLHFARGLALVVQTGAAQDAEGPLTFVVHADRRLIAVGQVKGKVLVISVCHGSILLFMMILI